MSTIFDVFAWWLDELISDLLVYESFTGGVKYWKCWSLSSKLIWKLSDLKDGWNVVRIWDEPLVFCTQAKRWFVFEVIKLQRQFPKK